MEAAPPASGFSLFKIHVLYYLPQAVRLTHAARDQPVSQSDQEFIAGEDAIGVARTDLPGRQVESYTFKGFEAFTAATLVYLGLSLIISWLVMLYSKYILNPIGVR